MLKKIITALFILIFAVFALDYFKIIPDDRTLAFNNISFTQEQKINSFSVIEKPQQEQKFTDRISNKDKTH